MAKFPIFFKATTYSKVSIIRPDRDHSRLLEFEKKIVLVV